MYGNFGIMVINYGNFHGNFFQKFFSSLESSTFREKTHRREVILIV